MSRAAVAAAPSLPPPIASEPVAQVESASTPQQEESSSDEGRADQLHALDPLPFTCKARLRFGPVVTVIDISNSGAQIETTNYRIQPGSAVMLEIAGPQGELAIPATVLRCQLANLLPEPIYRGALAFRRDFDVRSLGVPAEAEPAMELNPATELGCLRRAIERLAIGEGGGPTPEPVMTALLGALNAADATRETPAGRRAGIELERELALLFHEIASALERTPTPASLQTAVQEHLCRVVPGHGIHVWELGTSATASGAEAILISIPRLSADAPAARLSVEFPDGAEPQGVHLQLLKAAVQLIALARELGRLTGANRPLHVRGPEPLPDGWSRVVVCFANGQTRKGFTTEFTASTGHLELTSKPTSSTKAVLIPFTELKTIHFVKDPARGGSGAGGGVGVLLPRGGSCVSPSAMVSTLRARPTATAAVRPDSSCSRWIRRAKTSACSSSGLPPNMCCSASARPTFALERGKPTTHR